MTSFFGKKSQEKEESSTNTNVSVISTGGRIDDITAELISAAADSDAEVTRGISKALFDIGKKQPDLVLSSCNDFFNKNKALAQPHRIILLTIMYNILELRKMEIDHNLGNQLIQLGIAEMTKEKEVVPEWQQAASNLLISLATRFPDLILNELLNRFQAGTVPHYFVMKTLGDVVAANSVDTVPKLKVIMARILPVLASVKMENMRWAFAAGIGHFCESITHYVANRDKAEDKSFDLYSFSSDMFPAYDFMFNNWLGSKESKVRLATLQSLGSICGVLTREQLEAQLPKIVPVFMNFFKKEKDLLPISQGFNSLVWVAVKDKSRILDPQLPSILAVIHPLSVIVPEYSNHSTTVKNYNELLRVWQTVGVSFSENIISFLLERLGPKDAKTRVGTLAIIRHLITHSEDRLDDLRGLIVSGVKPLVKTENSLKVKKEIGQIVIAMASKDYLSLMGGEEMIEFIVRNASITDEEIEKWKKAKEKAKDKDLDEDPEEFRGMCDNILNLITTTIEGTDKVLWPYLLEMVTQKEYAGALGVLCKCLSFIAEKKRESEAADYIIDFDKAVNLPKPPAIIARLLIMLNAPQRRGPLGANILNLMKNIGPVLHPSICDMWDAALPKLISFLDDPAKWNPTFWEELVLRLLGETIKVANDDDWTMQLGDSLEKQIPLYANDPELKRIAFKHLGLILQKTTHKEFIKTKLEKMLETTDSNNEAERTGCAQAFGYASTAHLDMALEKVNTPAKPAQQKKEGMFSFLSSSKSGDEAGAFNNTIVLIYGYITAYALPNLITSRIEISILNNLRTMIPKAKTQVNKECIVKTVDLIAKAMHPSHLKKEFTFKQRDELLGIVLGYMAPKDPKENADQLRVIGLPAISALINLDPVLPAELETQLLEKVVTFYGVGTSDVQKQIVQNLDALFLSILYSAPSVDTLTRLFKVIEPFVCSKESIQRERSSATVLFLLKKFIEIKKQEEGERKEKSFSAVGPCIAMLIPRCTDPIVVVRQTAVEAIQAALYIDMLLKSKPGADSEAIFNDLSPFTDIKERIVAEELNEQFSIVHEMSRFLAKLVSPAELPDLLLTLLKGLNDPQLTSTSGTCVMLNGLVKARGKELLPKVPQIVSGLLSAMEGILNEQTMNGTLHTVRSLAVHHEIAVIDKLLEAPTPHSTHIIKAFQVIAKDSNLVMPLVNHLLEIINNGQLYEEKMDPKNKKQGLVANHKPMSATATIGELMQLEELEDVATENYPMFVSSLLMRFGTSNGMTDNVAVEQTVASFKKFLECSKDEAVESALQKDDNMGRLTRTDYTKAITDITAAMCKSHQKEMRQIYEFMFPYLKGNFIGQRIVAATVFAEFINQCKNDKQLLQLLVNYMLFGLGDPSVKIQALRGLGNIVSVEREEANKWAPTVLDALLTSIDDQNEMIAMEAMNGLSKVFAIVEESRMSPILINVCNRIRPAFDKTSEEIRAASFQMFGSLFRFGKGAASEAFYEQIHNYLPTLVLHLGEDNEAIKNACRGALRKLGPLFKDQDLAEFFNSELEEGRYLDYAEFLNTLSIKLIAAFPQRINTYVMTCVEYYKSSWDIIKANGAAFTGFLLGNLPIDKRRTINPTIVSRALMNLLKEKSPLVRKTAAEAMSLLHTY